MYKAMYDGYLFVCNERESSIKSSKTKKEADEGEI